MGKAGWRLGLALKAVLVFALRVCLDVGQYPAMYFVNDVVTPNLPVERRFDVMIIPSGSL